MRRTLLACLTLCLLTACATPTSPAPIPTLAPIPEITAHGPFLRDQLTGLWVGGFTPTDGSPISIQLDFASVSSGTVTLQPHIATADLVDLKLTGSQLSFTATGTKPAAFETLAFEGTFEASALKGSLTVDGATGLVEFAPVDAPSTIQVNNYLSLYQFESGRAINIVPAPEFNVGGMYGFAPGLLVIDYETGRMHTLYPVSPDTFLVGATHSSGFPFAGQLIFRDSEPSLIWQNVNPATTAPLGTPESASRISVTTEEVRYPSADGTRLAGFLTMPTTPGPHPAMVLMHGSERGQRNSFGQQALTGFFVSQGIATLGYDKRGVDESEGVYQEAASESNLNVQAQDASAGAAYLKSRTEIDSEQIGLIGGSQSGWVIPIAATQSSDVAFFIITSGPMVSVGLEDLYSAFTNDGESSQQMTQEEISEQLASFGSLGGFDPVPLVAELNQPGLWLWGDMDKNIPVPESMTALEQLITSGKTNFNYTVFPGADHFLSRSTTGLIRDYPLSPGYPENYFSTMAEWLAEHVK